LAVTCAWTVAALACADIILMAQYKGIVETWVSAGRSQQLRDRMDELSPVVADLNGLRLVAVIGASTAWVLWLSRVRRNADLLWPDRYKPSGRLLVAGLLFPFVSLVTRKQVVNQTWLATERFLASPGGPPPPGPRLLYAWWTVWLSSIVVAQAAGWMHSDGGEGVSLMVTVRQFADVMTIIAGLLGIAVIRRMTHRQRAAASKQRRILLSHLG